MTDKEFIEALATAQGIGGFYDADWNRLLSLARAGLAKQPPEGAVKVQLAVVYGVGGEVISFPCGDWEAPEEALNAARRCVDMPTHVAIVTAWLPPLPPVQTLEVGGTCSQSS